MTKEVELKNNEVERTRPTRVFTPLCDIYESDGAVHILAEMPGVDPKSIDVTLERRILTISGRFDVREPEGYRRVYAEFESGEYRRAFELSGDSDAANIQAELEHGLLRVTVPKTKPAQRKIPVLAR